MMTPEISGAQRREVTGKSTNVLYCPTGGRVFNVAGPPRLPWTQAVPGVPMFKAKVTYIRFLIIYYIFGRIKNILIPEVSY